jgi:hypothetical protein
VVRIMLVVGIMTVSVYYSIVDTDLESVAHNIVFFGADYL